MIDLQLIQASLPALLRGTKYTLLIASGSCSIGFVLGTVLGVIQARVPGLPRLTVQLATTILRGTPMLMQIVFLNTFFIVLGIKCSPILTAIIAIGINSAAYISQTIRSGILAVGKGQSEAAQVLGLSRAQTLRYIILPQALRIVLPTLGNEFITLIKDSSLASTIGVMELFKEGRSITYETLDVLTMLVAVGSIYLILTGIVSAIMHAVERSLATPQN